MRVLCFDLGGLLPGLPPPVLLPEFGDSFRHLTRIDGYAEAGFTDLLHAGDQDEAREIWMLWDEKTGRQEIEPALQRVYALLDQHVVPIHIVLVKHLEGGADASDFISQHHRIDLLAGLLSVSTQPRVPCTVALGLVDTAPEFREFQIALALRVWLERRRYPKKNGNSEHLRVLIRYGKSEEGSNLKTLLASKRRNWQAEYETLHHKVDRLKKQPSAAQLLEIPSVEWEKPNVSISDKKLYRRWPFGDRNHLGWFLGQEDSGVARLWTNHIFSHFQKGIVTAWDNAYQKYQAQLATIHNSDYRTYAGDTETATPWQLVEKLTEQLATVVRQTPASETSEKACLVSEIEARKQQSLASLLTAIRCRAGIASFFSWSGGALAIITVINALIVHTNTPQGITPFPGWKWPATCALILLISVLWGLWRMQRPAQTVRDTTLDWLTRSKANIEERFTSYTTTLGTAIRRMVLIRNLDAAQKEMKVRDTQLSQMQYHINLLNEYAKTYTGDDLQYTLSQSTSGSIDIQRSESDNKAYFWRDLSRQEISWDTYCSGAPSKEKIIPDEHSLAGVSSVEIYALSPAGRPSSGTGKKRDDRP